MKESFYKILGIAESATQDEIKLAYRKLAMRWHPDRAGGDKETFQRIQEAYDTLSIETKRAAYDSRNQNNYYEDILNSARQKRQYSQEDFMSEHIKEILRQQGMDHIYDEILRSKKKQRVNKNRDMRAELTLTLAESLVEQKRIITYGTIAGTETQLEITIPPISQINGYRIRYPKYGDDTYKDVPRGDLILNVDVALPDNYWIEHDTILCTSVTLDVWDAAIGVEHDLHLFDGTTIRVKIPAGTNPGSKFKIREKGMVQFKSQRGDLNVIVYVTVPKITNPEAVQLIKEAQAKSE